MGKRLPIAHRPSARKPQRSHAVVKLGGVPYTPAKQLMPTAKRNEGRVGNQTQGQSTAPANSLVGLLALPTLELAEKLRELGFLKDIKRCPTCARQLSNMKLVRNRVYYRCSHCRGDSGYVAATRGSILAKGLRLNLQQMAALIACFSEGVSPMQASQLCGVTRETTSDWYQDFRQCLVKRMKQMQESFGKQGGRGIITEADEASIASGPIGAQTKTVPPKFSYTRIIAMLVRGSRNLIIEELPVKQQRYRLKGQQKTMSVVNMFHKQACRVVVDPAPSPTRPLRWVLDEPGTLDSLHVDE